jgi:hypothetical protein
LEKSKELKLGYEVYFCRFTYWAPLEMLLSLCAILSYFGHFMSGVHFESLELAMKCRMRALTWIKQMHRGPRYTGLEGYFSSIS